MSTSFSRLMEEAKVPKKVNLPGGKEGTRSFHSLRHFYVSASANAQVPEDVRKILAAHKSGSVHQIYTHHDKDTLRAGINSLPKIDG